LWAVLATEAAHSGAVDGLGRLHGDRAATFVRYTNVVILGCAVVAVVAVWRLRGVRLPFRACAGACVRAVFSAGVAIFDDGFTAAR
jgi:hypothetical protein